MKERAATLRPRGFSMSGQACKGSVFFQQFQRYRADVLNPPATIPGSGLRGVEAVAIVTPVQYPALEEPRDRCVKNFPHSIPLPWSPPLPRLADIAGGNLASLFIDSRLAFTAGLGKPLHRL